MTSVKEQIISVVIVWFLSIPLNSYQKWLIDKADLLCTPSYSNQAHDGFHV